MNSRENSCVILVEAVAPSSASASAWEEVVAACVTSMSLLGCKGCQSNLLWKPRKGGKGGPAREKKGKKGEHILRRLRAQPFQRVALPPNLLWVQLRGAAGVRAAVGGGGAVVGRVGVGEELGCVGGLGKGGRGVSHCISV